MSATCSRDGAQSPLRGSHDSIGRMGGCRPPSTGSKPVATEQPPLAGLGKGKRVWLGQFHGLKARGYRTVAPTGLGRRKRVRLGRFHGLKARGYRTLAPCGAEGKAPAAAVAGCRFPPLGLGCYGARFPPTDLPSFAVASVPSCLHPYFPLRRRPCRFGSCLPGPWSQVPVPAVRAVHVSRISAK